MTDPSDGAVERRNLLVDHALQGSCPERGAHRCASLSEVVEAAEATPLAQTLLEGALALAPVPRGEEAGAWVEREFRFWKLLRRADACLVSRFDEPPPVTGGLPADLAQTCAPLDGREKISVWLPAGLTDPQA